jgi:hypothetical protein
VRRAAVEPDAEQMVIGGAGNRDFEAHGLKNSTMGVASRNGLAATHNRGQVDVLPAQRG